MKRVVLSLAVLCAMWPMAYGAVLSDSVYVIEGSPFEGYGRTVTCGPAFMPLRRNYSLSRIRLCYDGLYSNRAKIASSGENRNSGEIQARTYLRNGGNTIWGEASYANGTIKRQLWGETDSPQEIFPYMQADTAGGNLETESYLFGGGYAMRAGNLFWGVGARYESRLSYRKIDPRPKNTSGKLTADAGVAYAIGRYSAGVTLHLGKYKLSSDIKNMSELGESPIYHLTGLGGRYKRFDGLGKSVFVDNKHYALSMGFYPLSGRGFYGRLSGGVTDLGYVIRDLGNLPMASCDGHGYSFLVGWRHGSHDGKRVAVRLMADRDDRHGIENIFGDPASGVYPKIASLRALEQKKRNIAIGEVYGIRLRRWVFEASPTLGLRHISLCRNDDGARMMSDSGHASMRLFAGGKVAGRWLLCVDASWTGRFDIKSSLDMPMADDEVTQKLQSSIRRDFYNLACGAWLIKLKAEATHTLANGHGVALAISYDRHDYSSGLNANGLIVNLNYLF